MGSARVEALTKECTYAIDFLEVYPTTTLEFVKHLEFIDEASGRLDGIENEIDYAKEVYDIIEEFHVPVPADEIEAYYNFGSILTSLRNLCERKLADKADLIEKFNKQLSKDISNLIREVGLIQDESIVSILLIIRNNFSLPRTCTKQHHIDCFSKIGSFRRNPIQTIVNLHSM